MDDIIYSLADLEYCSCQFEIPERSILVKSFLVSLASYITVAALLSISAGAASPVKNTNVSSNVGKELKSLPSLHLLKLGGGSKVAPLNVDVIQKQLPACRVVLVDNKYEFAKKIFSPLH